MDTETTDAPSLSRVLDPDLFGYVLLDTANNMEAKAGAIQCPLESDTRQNMGRKEGSRNDTLAFKRQVVAEALAAPSIAAIARRHGLNANMVHLWSKERFYNMSAPPDRVIAEIDAEGF
ncbi:transposase [Citreicella sp. C3M06]|uniref:transposase n=1 Tax=Citreicella sp. C3M06 TaxID=2841564 RepID=UPI001C09A755|nr:transposase [Citreicella sp. C3M06]MBU2961599.1 transposase [Citreicella sp. C3M06]